MAGEPHPHHEASSDRSTSHAPRSAIWKSVIGATGGWGCERATFYRETVRDPATGRRLDDGADEPVLFGIAIDRAHTRLMTARLGTGPVDASLIDVVTDGTEPITEQRVWDDCTAAVRAGVESARGRLLRAPMTEDDWRTFAERVGLATEKLLGLWPNRAKDERDGTVLALPEPDGTPPGPPIAWLDQPPGVFTQPQRKMYAPDVVGGRGISGQPDYVFSRDGLIVGWVDVKALSRSGSYPAKWAAGEAVAYDYLCASENGGVVPEWHGYLEFRRVAKPYWALIIAPVEPRSIVLAEWYFARWAKALDDGSADGLSFNPRACGKCSFRQTILAADFPGCPIGDAAVAVAPVADEDE